MNSDSCQGCARAHREDGFAVPGSPACLGCRRAVSRPPGLPDLWVARPPGGTEVACDARAVTFTAPLPAIVRHGLLALACLVCITWAPESGLLLPGAILVAAAGLWAALARYPWGIRHTWGVWDSRVWHIAALGALSITRAYSAGAVRTFHCAGARAGGPVCFHHGPYTVAVTALPSRTDNVWLMRQLNDRLARERRGARREA